MMNKSRCIRCGSEISSDKHHAVHGICENCFEKMDPAEKMSLHPEWTLHHEDAENQIIDGHRLVCPLCGHDRFWKRITVMITPAAATWNWLPGSKKSINYICDRCGYIFSFLREPTKS
ncbi:MAG: hypothetical protein PHW79_10225 [Candidatus Marinimicrobia bacterium]|jgi:reverse gyrase|nr:hypothetical protein [Candidatus Neomarinimicrobiota bacterium]